MVFRIISPDDAVDLLAVKDSSADSVCTYHICKVDNQDPKHQTDGPSIAMFDLPCEGYDIKEYAKAAEDDERVVHGTEQPSEESLLCRDETACIDLSPKQKNQTKG